MKSLFSQAVYQYLIIRFCSHSVVNEHKHSLLKLVGKIHSANGRKLTHHISFPEGCCYCYIWIP